MLRVICKHFLLGLKDTQLLPFRRAAGGRHRGRERKKTHSRELHAAVTALGGSASLLGVKATENATRGALDADLVGLSVVCLSAALLVLLVCGAVLLAYTAVVRM